MPTPLDNNDAIPQSARSFATRWKHDELFAKGFVAIPTLFLRLYAHLKPHRLTLGEVLFVLHLMEFKWDAEAPFPGYATIAQRMGISDKMARRYAQSLEAKKYLRREIRKGQTNRFDLSPLFDALLRTVRAESTKAKETNRRIPTRDQRDEMIGWITRMMDTYRKMSRKDRKALAEWEAANIGGSVATSDWPGWEPLIGRRP